MIDFKKYKRFFAFGCSMTAYGWPTWADIIGREIPEYRNYAQSGGGNLFIACQLTEAHQRHKFNKDDLVMVMWSSVSREDRYINGTWLTPGNIYTQNYYDEQFVMKFSDDFGYLLRDINMITLSKNLLDNLGIDYYMLNMSPLTIEAKTTTERNKLTQLRQYYKDTLDAILPDILTLECNGVWPQHPISKEGHQSADYHPSPKQHFGYLSKLFPDQEWSINTFSWLNVQQTKMEALRNFDDMHFRQPPNDRL